MDNATLDAHASSTEESAVDDATLDAHGAINEAGAGERTALSVHDGGVSEATFDTKVFSSKEGDERRVLRDQSVGECGGAVSAARFGGNASVEEKGKLDYYAVAS